MKNLLLIHFENGNHFNFLKIKKNEKISDININNNVTVNKFTYKFSNSLCINEIANNNKYVAIKNNKNYYDDIFNYLYTKKINSNNENKEIWKNVYILNYLSLLIKRL